jgi:hypothetical protein
MRLMELTETTRGIRDAMPLCAALGMEAEEATPESVILTLNWTPELCTGGDPDPGRARSDPLSWAVPLAGTGTRPLQTTPASR